MATTTSVDIMITAQARVFIAEYGSGCGKEYDYHNCMKVEGLSKEYGDIEPVYCQDKNSPGKFKQVAAVRGEESLWTSTLSGYRKLSSQSTLARMARAGCKFDLQVHYGSCSNLSDFDTFDTAIIFEDVLITDYGADPLSATQPSDNAPVMETVSITAANVYEIYDAQLVRSATSVAESSGPIIAIAICGTSCDDGCSDSCSNLFAVQMPLVFTGTDAGDSLRLLKTTDGGLSWDTIAFPDSFPTVGVLMGSVHIVCTGDYVVVTLDTATQQGLVYALARTGLDGTTTDDYTTAVFGDTVTDLKILGRYIYATMDTGRIIRFTASTLSPETIEDGTFYLDEWYAVDGINADNILFAGANGTLAHRRKGASLRTVLVENAAGGQVADDLTAVDMKSSTEWYVGTDTGLIYCTADAGVNWLQVATLAGCVSKIDFPTRNVGYAVVRNPGAVYRTVDGGNSWQKMTDSLAGATANTTYDDLAVCEDDPWQITVVGHTAVTPNCDKLTETLVAGQTGLIVVGA